ncbi:transmembrane protein, putative (macronuclear) [Tetrahymena thermophila SB210]|uniref:Transmembrane protein, putative n=1 Tax=Tetrahymena thermophila (strain SB210) TaxID=312017 RepID=W7X6D9_TETTS|nr:transmembrane protein, putative [Tetrahymena thermophila SB210]EWS71918.1 transmembrane protein, putative [Tetrahymena thermophila SB210]|eukprot:XP_012655547.1 transmembrane protein, putative [Tetrahymena thermophila SB210]
MRFFYNTLVFLIINDLSFQVKHIVLERIKQIAIPIYFNQPYSLSFMVSYIGIIIFNFYNICYLCIQKRNLIKAILIIKSVKIIALVFSHNNSNKIIILKIYFKQLFLLNILSQSFLWRKRRRRTCFSQLRCMMILLLLFLLHINYNQKSISCQCYQMILRNIKLIYFSILKRASQVESFIFFMILNVF